MKKTLISGAFATVLAASTLAAPAFAVEKSPVFGKAAVTTMSAAEAKGVTAKGYYADLYGYYGNIYAEAAYAWGSYAYSYAAANSYDEYNSYWTAAGYAYTAYELYYYAGLYSYYGY